MKKYYISFGIFTICLLGILFLKYQTVTNQGVMINDEMRVSVHTTFAEVPVNEQIKKSDVIVSGTIVDISTTQWNQDSGEYWEETHKGVFRNATAYHTITILNERSLVNEKRLEKEIVLTIAAASPLDFESHETAFSVGDKVVFIARRSQMEWRNGKRPILMLLSSPEASIYKQDSDGLYSIEGSDGELSFDELSSKISSLRQSQN